MQTRSEKMSCHRCHQRLIDSQFMANLDESVPVVHDETFHPRPKNGFARTVLENRPGFPGYSTEPTIQENVYGRQMPTYSNSSRTISRLAEQSVGPQPRKFSNYVPTYSNSTRTVSGRPEQSVGPQPGNFPNYVPT